ncbi:unnamed protein product, partial [Ceratitis capitata]
PSFSRESVKDKRETKPCSEVWCTDVLQLVLLRGNCGIQNKAVNTNVQVTPAFSKQKLFGTSLCDETILKLSGQ